MSMAWGPGRYDTGPGQQSNGGSAGSSAACDCNKICCIGSTETHYGNPALAAGMIERVEQAGRNILTNRSAMKFKNPAKATTTFEVSTQQKWVFGDGSAEPVGPGESLSLAVVASVIHYVQCDPAGGGTCDYRVTELGV